MFQFSRVLAYVFGISLPALETIRRASQLGHLSVWPSWLDDVLLGALLLVGARLTSGPRHDNAKYLAAAWGVACGMAYYSFFQQLLQLDLPDPSHLPSLWVAVLKGLGFAAAIAALIGALKQPPAVPELNQHPERLDEMLDSTDDA
jgi:hypothetical protein